eukprot:CAMPEP_0170146042 /NCGR_PEP_ID=MMETSP0033_2-20121228/27721_1 /TAXON_ID=195969 /ORGANISM="Dolichomastix tenuilepis, Strain CCMP3274" /LENGTH=506 /DNA_ID=CAMNT_0010382711 /DNA_START=1 /DNA_END=1521 /DNA_ORIENTATION=-
MATSTTAARAVSSRDAGGGNNVMVVGSPSLRGSSSSFQDNTAPITYGALAAKGAAWVLAQAEPAFVGPGVFWPDSVIGQSFETRFNRSLDLYSGSAGCIVGMLEAWRAADPGTGDDYLKAAMAASDHLLHELPGLLSASPDTGLYHGGISGVGFVLFEVAQAVGGETGKSYMQGSLDVLEYVLGHASDAGELEFKYKWCLRWGTAGVGFWVLDMATRLPADQADTAAKALAAARKAGEWLIDQGTPTPNGGLKWFANNQQLEAPNYAYGTSGIAYYLATLYSVTNETVFLDGAVAGASYLQSIADTSDGGCVIWHTSNKQDLIYLTECNGPPGTGRLWVRLYQITGNLVWLDWAWKSTQTLIDHSLHPRSREPRAGESAYQWYYYKSGAPTSNWLNVGQCDGSAGAIEFYLVMYALTGDPKALNHAAAVADDLVRLATVQGNQAYWITEEQRTSPHRSRSAQVGYMQGASGIASVLLGLNHAINPSTRSPNRLILPDSPRAFGFHG